MSEALGRHNMSTLNYRFDYREDGVYYWQRFDPDAATLGEQYTDATCPVNWFWGNSLQKELP